MAYQNQPYPHLILQYKVLYTNELRQFCSRRHDGQRVESTDGEAEVMRSWVYTILRDKCGFESVGYFSYGATMSSEAVEECDVLESVNQSASDTAHRPKHIPAFPAGRVLELVALNCRQQR